MTDRVAIIMPIFPGNDHPRIRRAVESIYMQTFWDWHLYMVYDGPCVPFIPLDTRRITIIFAPHQGAGLCRAQAIEMGREPFIAYLDHDDRWHQEHLEILLPGVERHDFVFSKGLGFGGPMTGRDEQVLPDGRALFPPPYWNPAYLDRQNVTPAIGVMHTRDLYERTGSWQTERWEDWRLWQRMAAIKQPVHIDMITYEYEIRPGSLSETAEKMGRGII